MGDIVGRSANINCVFCCVKAIVVRKIGLILRHILLSILSNWAPKWLDKRQIGRLQSGKPTAPLLRNLKTLRVRDERPFNFYIEIHLQRSYDSHTMISTSFLIWCANYYVVLEMHVWVTDSILVCVLQIWGENGIMIHVAVFSPPTTSRFSSNWIEPFLSFFFLICMIQLFLLFSHT